MGLDDLVSQFGPFGLMIGGLAWAYMRERNEVSRLNSTLLENYRDELKKSIEREMQTIENLRKILQIVNDIKEGKK